MPSGARCTFWRNGGLVGDIGSTPGSVTIQKTKIDLFIVCDKPGYSTATYVNRSGLAMATYANILTAGLSWAVDSSRGADNKYEGEVNLSLVPLGTVAPIDSAPPAPVPPVAVPRSGGSPSVQAPPSVAPAAAPAVPQLECASADGSRIRVTGAACPAGWTRAR